MERAYRHIAALGCAALALGLAPVWAQKPKSPKEAQAIMAVQAAKTPDDRIQAIEAVLTKYADTEFKVPLLQMAVQAEEQKGDFAQTVFYAERLLKADPKNAFAEVTLAAETARHTREYDLDKDEKLAKVEKWAHEGIENSKDMPKPNPQIPDAEWDGFKKDMAAQGYEALGMADAVRKNYDGAIKDYRDALANASAPNPATMVRLAQAYASAGKLDDANYTLDKAISAPNAPDSVKSVAQSLKNEIAKRKGAAPAGSAANGAGNSAPPANPAPANQNK